MGSSKVRSPPFFVAEIISVLLNSHAMRKTLQVLSWKSDIVKQKEAFMWVFCSNYFRMLQNAQNSKRLCYALYALYLGWTFCGTGLIILCQPLAPNIWAVILIKMITSIAVWNGKQNCSNERLCYNYLNGLNDNKGQDRTWSEVDPLTDRSPAVWWTNVMDLWSSSMSAWLKTFHTSPFSAMSERWKYMSVYLISIQVKHQHPGSPKLKAIQKHNP